MQRNSNAIKNSHIKSIERAVLILNTFRPYEHSVSLQTLSLRTGLHKSTLLRQLRTLVAERLVARLSDGTYQLGAGVLHWASVYRTTFDFDQHIPPVLHKLSQRTGEGASFFLRTDDMRVCLYRVDSPKELRDHLRQGELLPLDKGAAGRALLLYENPSPDSTAPSPPVITSIGEREAEIAAIASPIFHTSGLLGVMSLSGPVTRFDKAAIDRFSGLLLEAARDLSDTLGGKKLFSYFYQ